MSDDDLDSGLLGIALSDSEDDSPKSAPEPSREERNAQSEEEFQALKSVYKIKVENGEIWKGVVLPLGATVSKPAAQELVHAVEELYFFRRYEEAGDFVRRVMREGGQVGGGLDEDTRELLGYHEKRCGEKVKGNVK